MNPPSIPMFTESELTHILDLQKDLDLGFPTLDVSILYPTLHKLYTLSQQERYQMILPTEQYHFIQIFKQYLTQVSDRSTDTMLILTNITACLMKWSLVKLNAAYLGSATLGIAPLLLTYIEERRLRINIFYYFLNCLLENSTHSYLLSKEIGFLSYVHSLFVKDPNDDLSCWAIANITGNICDPSLDTLIGENIPIFIWQRLFREGNNPLFWNNRMNGRAFRCLFVIMYLIVYEKGYQAIVQSGLQIDYFLQLALNSRVRESLPAKIICLNYFHYSQLEYLQMLPISTIEIILDLLLTFIKDILQVFPRSLDDQDRYKIRQFTYGVFRLDTITATIGNLCSIERFYLNFPISFVKHFINIFHDFVFNVYEHSEIVHGLRQHAGGGGRDLRSIENILRFFIIYFSHESEDLVSLKASDVTNEEPAIVQNLISMFAEPDEFELYEDLDEEEEDLPLPNEVENLAMAREDPSTVENCKSDYIIETTDLENVVYEIVQQILSLAHSGERQINRTIEHYCQILLQIRQSNQLKSEFQQVHSAACNSFVNRCPVGLGQVFTENNKPIKLLNSSQYYIYFEIPPFANSIDLNLALYYGYVELYTAKDRQPTRFNYDRSNVRSGDPDYLSIIDASNQGLAGAINILIVAVGGPASFSGLVTSPNTVNQLVTGLPQLLHFFHPGQLQLFTATIGNKDNASIVVTPITATMPRLQVALPSNPSNLMISNDGFIAYKPAASDVNKKIQFQLFSPNSTVVSIVMHESMNYDAKPISLMSGIPQNDMVNYHNSHYYYFTVPPNVNTDVKIMVTSLEGDADLYVNPYFRGFFHRESLNSPNPDDPPVWSSARPSGVDMITILPTDPEYVSAGGAYYISVYGYQKSTYSVKAILGTTVVTLVEAVTVQDTLTSGQYRYYRYYDFDPTQDIYVDLAPSIGDADLFISCILKTTGDRNGYPSSAPGHYNFSSRSYMEDTIDISPNSPQNCRNRRGGVPVYYLAVYAFSDSTYQITTMHSGGVTPLSSGTSLNGIVYKQLSRRYKIRSSFEIQKLTIQLTPLYGDCDLFVSMNSQPEIYKYDYRSINAGRATDIVIIPETDICSDCWVNILVYGYQTASFTILATYTDTVINLLNGMASRGSVGDSYYQYYTFTPSVQSAVSTVLTIFAGRIPSIFMSTVTQYPNATTPGTVSRLSTSVDGSIPVLTILANSVVYISIYGDHVNSSYTIRATQTPIDRSLPPTIVTLYEGLPQADMISVHSVSDRLYYAVRVPAGHEGIKLRAESIEGDVDLFVLKCNLNSTYQCASNRALLPNATHFTWTSQYLETDIINIVRNDAVSALYLITVISNSYYSAYQISYSLQNSILELQSGVAVTDHVFKGEMDYFSFYFTDQYEFEQMKFILTPFSGDPDMFISTRYSNPNAKNSTWKSFRFGSDVITINPSTDVNACQDCNYYIGVLGSSESTYTLRVVLESTLPALQDGIGLAGTVQPVQWSYYIYYDNYHEQRDFTITLTSRSGNADMFVTLDNSLPGLFHYDYYSDNINAIDQIRIHRNDSSYRRNCIHRNANGVGTTTSCAFTIGVYSIFGADYSIRVVSNLAATTLQYGVSSHGTVTIGDATLYKIIPSQDPTYKYTLHLAVTPISGHVSLYVNCGNTVPLRNASTWSLAPVVTGQVLKIESISLSDHHCLQTSPLYAAVYGDSSATFDIQASVANDSSIIRISPESRITSTVGYHQMNYYYLRPGSNFQNIKLYLTIYEGNADLYVSKSWETRPAYLNGVVTSYDYAGDSSGDDHLTISHNVVQDSCKGREHTCYFIVAVAGAYLSSVGDGTALTSYALIERLQDSTQTLVSGVPTKGWVDKGRYEYYSFSLLQTGFDVIVAVSALYGDPDIYVSLPPVYHPYRNNYTWSQASLGADTITLQYADIAKKCIPNPTTLKSCDFYIGVYGWKNSSYSITAKVNDGFLSPTLLLDQMPQSGFVAFGQYQYYRYIIQANSSNGYLPLAVKFVLTPTDGGDLDLYLTFANLTGATREPGKNNFDYRSTGWSSVAETISISYTMPKYCTSCVVFLGVFGYTQGSYTLQASSDGVLRLASDKSIGDNVVSNHYNYYSFYNHDQFAELSISLTTISGDADLYVIARPKTARNVDLPSKNHFTWRSIAVGSDTLMISYLDRNFCYDCEYVIAAFGYRNCTYTLLVSEHKASIVKLVPNRPQTYTLSSNDLQYFSTIITSSTADITISFTALNTGDADMYVELFNSTAFNSAAGGDTIRMPVPSDPSTYSYSTQNSQDNHIYLPGPHPQELVVVIAFQAISSIKFVITASSNARQVLLQPGVPQNHYVEQGENTYFKVYPEDDDDLRVTIMARTGDPDLFISTRSPYPHCNMGDNAWQVSCSNFTWSSRMYSTDQIIISRDSPCTALMSSTYITSDCNPEIDYISGPTTPVYIGIYGYRSSKFTILAVSTGMHINLQAGQPQLSTTTVGVICSQRNEVTGACSTTAKGAKKVQIAYFVFQIGQQAKPEDKVSEVLFTVIPSCNATARRNDSSIPCPVGCSCQPLQVYITYCPGSTCTEQDKKPSELTGQSKASFIVNSISGTTFSISRFNKNAAAFCDPDTIHDNCMYYLSVSHHGSADQVATFSIAARTPGDAALIPCDSKKYPDGIKYNIIDDFTLNGKSASITSPPIQHLFEVCSQSATPKKLTIPSIASPVLTTTSEYPLAPYATVASSSSYDWRNDLSDRSIISPYSVPSESNTKRRLQTTATEDLYVEVERCYGNVTLYACSDNNKCKTVVPSKNSWEYYADALKTCIHHFDTPTNSLKKEDCYPQIPGKIYMRLPGIDGNYYLVSEGKGRYNLQIHSARNSIDLSPKVVVYGGGGGGGINNNDATNSNIQILTITGNTATFQWKQSRVLMPGSNTPVIADYLSYQSYLFDANDLNKLLAGNAAAMIPFTLTTFCGLESATAYMTTRSVTIATLSLSPLERSKESMSHKVQGLKVNTKYTILIVATCDGNCLRQLSKQVNYKKVLINCAIGEEECKTQYYVYPAISFQTKAKQDSGGGGGDDSSSTDNDTSSTKDSTISVFVIIGIIVAVVIVIAMIGIAYYWQKLNENWFGASLCAPFESLRAMFPSVSLRGSSGGGANDYASSTHSMTEMIDTKRFGGRGEPGRGGRGSGGGRGRASGPYSAVNNEEDFSNHNYEPPLMSSYPNGSETKVGALDFRGAATNASDGAKKIWSTITSTAKNISSSIQSSTNGSSSNQKWGPPVAGKPPVSSSSSLNPIHNQQFKPRTNKSTFVVQDEDEEEDEDGYGEDMQISL